MERGRLKIFFGYSAGVGKTYAMLKTAHKVLDEGVDIVIGYIEPHDRADTMALTVGLPAIPIKKVEYKGIVINEFDIDATIARHPSIVLVDELAHTNAPGSRNSKRYLDVEELLNNGIDVWTTVNVQHIEGLRDLVDNATAVDVGERVPDEIFDYSDEVVLIDIEPIDLIERMREGKVYNRTKAKVALDNFFREDHLASLRELFLRRGADRIEKQAFNGERKSDILVLISPSPSSEKNIYVASRMADAYHSKFSAIYVERDAEITEESALRLEANVRLVKDLGGDMIIKYGEDVVETVADYVRIAGVTHIVMGKTWRSVGTKVGLEDRFIECMPQIEILIIPDNENCGYTRGKLKEWVSRLFFRRGIVRKYKMANRTLDIIRQLTFTAKSEDRERDIARVLSISFMRSVMIYSRHITIVPYDGEDVEFFRDEHERASAAWVKRNNKVAGQGTSTLRDSKAIYFPIESKHGTIAVGFSSKGGSMSVVDSATFSEIAGVLAILF